MTDTVLVKRLESLPNLDKIPRKELEWLVANGHYETHQAGTVIAPKGKRIENLYIVLSGHITSQRDRGTGPQRVIEWYSGSVTGMLPYSRMTAPPGDNYLEIKSELLTIHEKHFPEMIQQCPAFTALTVHSMLDRARVFKSSELQNEKMISLGKLAAGLAHEINNPAAATVRGAKQLLESLAEADAASSSMGAAGLSSELTNSIEQLRSACLAQPIGNVFSPIEQADREEEIEDWLRDHHMDPTYAESLATTAINIDLLDKLANMIPGDKLPVVLRWIAAGCTTHTLAIDIMKASTRISELVAAIKRFTYMDKSAKPELVDVETGLQDTIRVLGSKVKSKGATLTIDVEADLPPVLAIGGELNQIWLNLIDNALDAISESGNIKIDARKDRDQVVVRVIDDGQGISPEDMPRIFDPFFTTKPPGAGTGLGLEITRQLVKTNRGDISVQSRPGQTEFIISLVAGKIVPKGPDEQKKARSGQ
ncbi:MAG: ATP-binding protein [bacterium]|nr:MAG: ATP-binding protein [bacterium]